MSYGRTGKSVGDICWGYLLGISVGDICWGYFLGYLLGISLSIE
jgi:hypothetical protein